MVVVVVVGVVGSDSITRIEHFQNLSSCKSHHIEYGARILSSTGGHLPPKFKARSLTPPVASIKKHDVTLN